MEPFNGSQWVHERLTSQTQETEPHPSIQLSRLIGNQRDIVLALYKNIYRNDLLTTTELTLDQIAMLSGVNKKSLKNTLFRLVSSGFISRSDQKIGRGGWVKYILNPSLKEEIKRIGTTSMIKKT